MAEKEYIEREAAKMAVVEALGKGHSPFNAIVMLPAADVRPVVRGHWISEEEAEEKGDYSLRDACSVCGHCDWDCTESAGFNYCPNCGADMRPTSMSGANGEES